MRGDNGREWGAMGDQGRQDLEKAGTPFKQGNDGRRQGETRPCEGGHAIQHKRILWGDNRRQAETRPREGRHNIQHRHMWGDSGRQWQTRERPEKADIPSQAHMWGDNGRQKGKTTRREGRPTIQHRQMCGETMRDKTSERRTHHPTQTHMREDNGKHWETRERQDIENANTSSNTGTHVGTRQRGKSGDKVPGRRTRQPTKRKHEGRHWVGDKGRQDQGEHLKNPLRTPRAVHCLEDKKGDNVEIMWREGARCLGRRTHQPTKGNKKGYRRRQKETRLSAKGKTLRKADAPSNKGKQEGVQWETRPSERRTHHPQRETTRGTMGNTLGKASNKGKQEGVQSETRGDKTVGKANTPSNKGVKKGYNGRHRETRPSERQTHHPGTMGNGRQRETRKKGYNGRQYRRQDLGKADTRSNTKVDTLRKPTPTVHCLKKCKIRPPTTKGNKKKDKLGDKLGDKKEDKLGDKGDKGDKTSGRWTHHPTQGNKKGDKGETRPRESGRGWETKGDKTKANTLRMR